MKRNGDHVPLEESHITLHPAARPTRTRQGKRRIRVTLVLKSSELPHNHPTARKADRIISAPPHQRPRLTEKELEHFQCAAAAHVDAARAFARGHGLRVVEVSRVRHDLVLEGTLAQFNAAFQVDLQYFAHDETRFRAHLGPVQVPSGLTGAVDCVLGLDDIPLLDGPHAGRSAMSRFEHLLSPLEVAAYYRFPRQATGKGQKIALIEFGGGFHARDITEYFKMLGYERPTIDTRCLHGVRNAPLDYATMKKIITAMKRAPKAAHRQYKDLLNKFIATLEVTMDIQILGSLVPAAEIVVYFAPANGQGWRDAIYAAIQEPGVSIISISWGNVECRFSASHVRGIDDALRAARLRHITVCCSSGDFGSRGTPAAVESNGMANVAFPASSPYVLACGGSALQRSGRVISGEVAWNDRILGMQFATGGGVSGRFPLPEYQNRSGVPRPRRSSRRKTWLSDGNAAVSAYSGRGVPDVAAHADSLLGYHLILAGEDYVGGGTSAAAPLWAALIARLNECLGFPLGWANPTFYQHQVAQTFNRLAHGNNDVCNGQILFYLARRGWDACTGLGSPDGERLLEELRKLRV